MSYLELISRDQYYNPLLSTKHLTTREIYIEKCYINRVCNQLQAISTKCVNQFQLLPNAQQCQQIYYYNPAVSDIWQNINRIRQVKIFPHTLQSFYLNSGQNQQKINLSFFAQIQCNGKIQGNINEEVKKQENLKQQFQQKNEKLQENQVLNNKVPPVLVQVHGPSVQNHNIFRGKNKYEEVKKFEQLNLQDEKHNAPISLILGQVGVGKSSIMKKLFDNREINEFQPQYLPKLNSYFVDTRAFDFESSVEEREEQIKLYQQLFNYFPDKVSNIFIVVNFERTDLMKDKIIGVLTKFRKFIDRISIIITDFQLSENPQNDEKQLRNNLKYLNTRSIIFIGRNTSKDELIEKLRNVMLKNDQHFYPFDLKGTYFEVMNPEEINSMMEDFKNRLINN